MDAEAARTANHEAAHVAACHHFGWQIDGVYRSRDFSGGTLMQRRHGGDAKVKAWEHAIILIVPSTHGGANRCGDSDLDKVSRLVQKHGFKLSEVWDAGCALWEQPEFTRDVHTIMGALIFKTHLTGDEIAELLQ